MLAPRALLLRAARAGGARAASRAASRAGLARCFASAAPGAAPVAAAGAAPAGAAAAAAAVAGDGGGGCTVGLSLTPRAAARLASLRARAAADGRADAGALALRVRVDSGGCSGLRYDFTLDGGGARADDAAFGAGALALVDADSLPLLRGATVDWDESLVRSAFVVLANPNADTACGCKMSFAPVAKA